MMGNFIFQGPSSHRGMGRNFALVLVLGALCWGPWEADAEKIRNARNLLEGV